MFNQQNYYQQQQPGVMGTANGYINQTTHKPAGFTNALSDEKIAELLSNSAPSRAIVITETDLTQAICTHRYNGNSYLEKIDKGPDAEGDWFRCKICKEEFRLCEPSQQDIQLATDNLVSILNSAKVLNLDIPPKACEEFYQVIAYIKKAPQLFRDAVDNFKQYIPTNPQYSDYGYAANTFGVFNQLIGGGVVAPMDPNYMGAYGQPAGMYAPGAAPVYGQPVQPTYGQPVQPMYGQPVVYGQPMAQPVAPSGSNWFDQGQQQQQTAAPQPAPAVTIDKPVTK